MIKTKKKIQMIPDYGSDRFILDGLSFEDFKIGLKNLNEDIVIKSDLIILNANTDEGLEHLIMEIDNTFQGKLRPDWVTHMKKNRAFSDTYTIDSMMEKLQEAKNKLGGDAKILFADQAGIVDVYISDPFDYPCVYVSDIACCDKCGSDEDEMCDCYEWIDENYYELLNSKD